MSASCKHEWSPRGNKDDRWSKCWLCGVFADGWPKHINDMYRCDCLVIDPDGPDWQHAPSCPQNVRNVGESEGS